MTSPKDVVRRFVDVVNRGALDELDELLAAERVAAGREWVAGFRRAFRDFSMSVDELLADGDTVVARFRCSGTHTGTWCGYHGTGRRFDDVAQVYFFRVRQGRIASSWGLEDTWDRMSQLGLPPPQPGDD